MQQSTYFITHFCCKLHLFCYLQPPVLASMYELMWFFIQESGGHLLPIQKDPNLPPPNYDISVPGNNSCIYQGWIGGGGGGKIIWGVFPPPPQLIIFSLFFTYEEEGATAIEDSHTCTCTQHLAIFMPPYRRCRRHYVSGLSVRPDFRPDLRPDFVVYAITQVLLDGISSNLVQGCTTRSRWTD